MPDYQLPPIKPYPSIQRALDARDAAKSHFDAVVKLRQATCKHENGTRKYGASTGNYDRSNDCRWVQLHCPRCLSNRYVDGDEPDYRNIEGFPVDITSQTGC